MGCLKLIGFFGGELFLLFQIMSTILWLLAIAVMIACVFDGYDLKDDQSNALYDGLYLGLNRSVWSLALALVIILCVSGNGGENF